MAKSSDFSIQRTYQHQSLSETSREDVAHSLKTRTFPNSMEQAKLDLKRYKEAQARGETWADPCVKALEVKLGVRGRTRDINHQLPIQKSHELQS